MGARQVVGWPGREVSAETEALRAEGSDLGGRWAQVPPDTGAPVCSGRPDSRTYPAAAGHSGRNGESGPDSRT